MGLHSGLDLREGDQMLRNDLTSGMEKGNLRVKQRQGVKAVLLW